MSATNSDEPSNTDLVVIVTRLEAKVDVALAHQAAELSAVLKSNADHETRLREIEKRPTVSPRVLWASVCSGAGLVFGAVTIVNNIF